MSCKESSDSADALKVEFTFDDVNEAILAATKTQSPEDIKVDQYFKYEDNYQIELNEPQTISTFEGTVLQVNDNPNHIEIRVLETITQFVENGEPEVDTKEEIYNIGKQVTLNYFQLSPRNKLFNSVLPTSQLNTLNNGLKVYDLNVSTSNINYPLAVQERMNCDKNNPCQFQGTRIKFLLEDTANKNETNKVAIDRIYINNGNYLVGMYSSCQSQFVVIGDRDFYVKQCSVLRDFTE